MAAQGNMLFLPSAGARRWARPALGLALVLASAGPALALLPPYWQRAREIETIAADPGVATALERDGPMTGITAIGEDRYSVTTQHCRLEVTIVPKKASGAKAGDMPMVGPKQFSLKLGSPVCR